MAADAFEGNYAELAQRAEKEAKSQYKTLLKNVKKLPESQLEKALSEKQDQAVAALVELIANALGGKASGAVDSFLQVASLSLSPPLPCMHEFFLLDACILSSCMLAALPAIVLV